MFTVLLALYANPRSDGARRGGSTVVNCEGLTGQEWSCNQPDCNQRSTDNVHHEDLWVFVSRSPREDLANPDLLGDQAIGHIHKDDQAHTGLYESHQAPSPSRAVNTSCWSVHNYVSSVRQPRRRDRGTASSGRTPPGPIKCSAERCRRTVTTGLGSPYCKVTYCAQ